MSLPLLSIGRAASTLMACVLGAAAAAHAIAAPAACAGASHCTDLGPFTASVVRVNVTRQDSVTAYQGVRTTVRFTNVSAAPLILGYRDHSSAVTDDQGLAYRWSAKSYGIGVVGRDSADPQFQLAPGESREASFDGVLQYSLRRQVPGTVFSHDITIVQLGRAEGRRVRELRDHVVGFTGLTASSGFAAGANPVPPIGSPSFPSAAAPTAGAAPPPQSASAECAGAPPGACQATGPLLAQVVRISASESGNVTAYHTVRLMLRLTNTSADPLILAYKKGSGTMTDNNGQAYRWGTKAAGIGVVDGGSADPQFRLGPGESREAAFESTLQYNVRNGRPGTVYSQDMTIAQLAIVGPSQVRTLHEYALGFSNLSVGAGSAGAMAAGGAPANPADAVQTVNKVVDLFKALRK
jgi:hypothetical protein